MTLCSRVKQLDLFSVLHSGFNNSCLKSQRPTNAFQTMALCADEPRCYECFYFSLLVPSVCSMQGKRIACEDGSEGYSDLYQENAMLQRENDTLRLRVKAMQETIDHLNSRVTHLLANEISTLLAKSST